MNGQGGKINSIAMERVWKTSIKLLVECYGDITKTDFRKWRGRIDVLTGGFPCQPYSVAGKRLGKEDRTPLVIHTLRTIREIKPKYVVGKMFGELLVGTGIGIRRGASLTWCLKVTPSSRVYFQLAVSTPYRRERVWFAYREGLRGSQNMMSSNQKYISNMYGRKDYSQHQ